MKSIQSEIRQQLDQLIQQLRTSDDPASLEIDALLEKVSGVRNQFNMLSQWIASAQELSDVGSWEHYHKKDEIYWSAETYRILGYEPHSVEPSFELIEDMIHPEDKKKVNDAYHTSLNEKEPYNVVYRLVMPDDTIKYVEARAIHQYDEEGDPELTVGTNQNVTNREERETLLAKTLNTNKTLLEESHHRIKNHLAIVAGMLQLQWLEADDPRLTKTLEDSINRIKTIGSVHQQLYQSGQFGEVALGENIENLASQLIASMETSSEITLISNCESIYLEISQTLSCSLIANEVVTNAIKHAFIEQERGEISIDLKQNGNDIRLQISDNGIGLPNDFESKKGSLGMNLIEALSDQLGAKYEFTSSTNGTTFTLDFQTNMQ